MNQVRILIILLSLSLVVTGCTSSATEEEDLAQPLSLTEIVRALEEDGLQLTPLKDVSVPELSNVKPAVFQIEDSNCRLLVYLFPTIEQRREAEKEYDPPMTIRAPFYEMDNVRVLPRSAKNAVIAYYIPEVGERELSSLPMPGIETVRTTVFALNDGQEIVYAGESDSWEAQVVVRYHHYFFKNEKGVLYNDLNGTREVFSSL